MATTYAVYYRYPNGSLAERNPIEFSALEYARSENAVGAVTVTMPGIYPLNYFQEDGIFEIYRSVNGGTYTIDMETAWFIRKIQIGTSGDGEDYMIVTALDCNHLLDRRIVAYENGTAYTDKNGVADDVMKDIIRENFGVAVFDVTRNLSAFISVDGNSSLGTIEVKEIGWAGVKQALDDLANASLGNGVRLFYDLRYLGNMQFRFSTWKDYRGVDRTSDSANPLIVSIENGNLSDPELVLDYTQEYNYIYAVGRGEDNWVTEQEVADAARIGKSPFNRCELRYNARYCDSAASVASEAKNALAEFRPRAFFNGTILQTPNNIYGIHFGFGDLVTVSYKGFSFDARIATGRIKVDSGNGEEIEMRLMGDFSI